MILNHSAIGLLKCDRLYQLRVLLSIKESDDSDSLNFGNAMHKAIEAYHHAGRTLKNFDLLSTCNKLGDEFKLSGTLRGKLIGTVTTLTGFVKFPLHDTEDKPMVERKISFAADVDGTHVDVVGTLDEVHLNGNQTAIVLNDYKSSSYLTTPPLVEKYSFSSQLYYYMWMLNQNRHLIPSPYTNLPLQANYTLVLYNKSPVTVAKTATIQPDDLLIEDMIEDSVRKIKRIELLNQSGTIAAPLGRASDSCRYCGMKHICFSKLPLRDAINAAEKEPYDPLSFR